MEKQFLFVDVANPTWLVYLSVLVLAVFFRFSRLFTVRNLDLLLVLVLSSALVIAGEWKNRPQVVTAASADLSVDNANHDAQLAGNVARSGIPADSASKELPGNIENGTISSSVDVDLIQVPGQSPMIDSGEAGTRDVSLPGNIDRTTISDDVGQRVGSEYPNVDQFDPAIGEIIPTELPDNVSQSDNAPGTDLGVLSDVGSVSEAHPNSVYRWASFVLLALSFLLMIRLVFDESLTRRPRLEQNLNQAGLTFLCVPAFALLTVSVFVVEPPNSAMQAVEHGKALLERRETKASRQAAVEQPPAPTETLIAAGAAGVAQLSGQWEPRDAPSTATEANLEKTVAQILVVIAHTIVVLGLLHIGRQHYGSLQLGLSMSCLYLLLPCTAFNVHQLSHVLPGACLTWAIASYRKPVVSGLLLGLACGTLFFSVFLLPVWAVFYGRRGAVRFGLSVLVVAAILAVCLMLTSSDADSFVNKLFTTMNWTVYRLLDETGSGPEMPFGQLFIRIPLAAVFFVMLTAMTVLPRPRNLENLLANSTALVVAAQLWYPEDIGTYVLWYLPLLLLVVFRPRLDRFVPPDVSTRGAATAAPSTSSGAPASVALSRLTLYR